MSSNVEVFERMQSVALRLVNLLALLAAVAWLARPPDWEPLVTSVALLAGLIGQEIMPTKRPSKDKTLFERFLTEFPSSGRSARFLEHHDIGGTFQSTVLDELDKFVELWNDAEHEFQDKKLEAQRKKLLKIATNFRSELQCKTFPGVPGYLTMDLRDHEDRPEFLATQKRLNDLATEVYQEHQELVRLGRRIA